MATVGTWRRYELPGGRVAIDFDGPSLTTAAVVDLRTGEAVPLTDDEWLHLVERAKYMRSIAIRRNDVPPEPDDGEEPKS